MKYILTDDKAFVLLVLVDVASAVSWPIQLKSNMRVKTKWPRGGK